jgi:antitoxin VapB
VDGDPWLEAGLALPATRRSLSLGIDFFCQATSPPLNIKDPVTEKIVRELAAVTGESVTAAIRRAAEERLQLVGRQQAGRSLVAEILEIGKRCAALPDLDTRPADEIFDYDEHGLPR